MSGAGLIELLAARLGGRGVRRASPSLREALVDLSARSAEPGVAGQEEALRQAYGRLSMEMPTENLRLPTSRVSLDDLPDVGPGWRDKDKVAHYADLLAQSEPPPIMIARDARNGAWDVIDGNHRLEVMRAAGRREIPAMDATGAFKGRYVSSDAMPPKAAPRRTGPDAGPVQTGRVTGASTGYLSPRETAARDVIRSRPDISNEELSAALGMDDTRAAGIIRTRVEQKTGAQASSGERVRLVDMVRDQNLRMQRGQAAEVSHMSWDENTPMTMYQFPGDALTNVRITQRSDGVREVVFSARGLKQGSASRADIESVFGDALAAMERHAATNQGGRYFFEGETPAITRLHSLLLRNANLPDGVSVRPVGDGIEVTFGRTAPDGGSAQRGFDTDRVVYRGLGRPYDAADGGYYQSFTSSLDDAQEYGSNVIAAHIRPGRNLAIDGGGNNFNSLSVQQLPADVRARLHPGVGDAATTDQIAHAAREAGYDSVTVRNVHDNRWGERPGRNTEARTIDFVFDTKNISPLDNVPTQPPRAEAAAERVRLSEADRALLAELEDFPGSTLPPLRAHEGSWIGTSQTGEVREFFNQANAQKALDAGWTVRTAGDHLANLNRNGPNAGSDRNALQRALRDRMNRE